MASPQINPKLPPWPLQITGPQINPKFPPWPLRITGHGQIRSPAPNIHHTPLPDSQATLHCLAIVQAAIRGPTRCQNCHRTQTKFPTIKKKSRRNVPFSTGCNDSEVNPASSPLVQGSVSQSQDQDSGARDDSSFFLGTEGELLKEDL